MLTINIGYKLRRHIAKALQSRSQAIRTALSRYNEAAAALSPPGRILSWNEVVDYTFLADFDILRGRDDSTTLQPWATPGARQLLDSYFKIERAKEEIVRLDIEIQRVITYIRDEKEYLIKKQEEFQAIEPHLAFCIGEYQRRRGRFDNIHMDRFRSLKNKWGARFTGTLVPGVHIQQSFNVSSEDMVGIEDTSGDTTEKEAIELARRMESMAVTPDSDDEWEDDAGEEAEAEKVAEVMETVLTATADEASTAEM